MPEQSSSTVQELEVQATKKAEGYDWASATKLYQNALASINPEKDPSTAARLSNLVARSTYKTAFQSENPEEFVEKIRNAQAAYEKASVLYDKAGSMAQSKRFKARAHYVDYWLTDNPDERRQILQDCIDQTEEAARSLEQSSNKNGLAETYDDISTYLLDVIPMIAEEKSLMSRIRESVEIGRKATALQVELDDATLILEALASAIVIPTAFSESVEQPESVAEEMRQRSRELGDKLSSHYASCLAANIDAWNAFGFDKNYPRALELSSHGMKQALETRNRVLIAHAGYRSTVIAKRAEVTAEDAEGRREAINRGLRAVQLAIENGEVINYRSLLAVCYMHYANLYTDLATNVESALAERKSLLRTALEIGRKGMLYTHHNPGTEASSGLSLALLRLAEMEANTIEKGELLREAEDLRADVLRDWEKLNPGSLGSALDIGEFALIKARLADLEEKPEAKVQLLQEAASNMQRCVAIFSAHNDMPSRTARLASFEESYGDILISLHPPTTQPDQAKLALKQYEDSLTLLHTLTFTESSAKLNWKLARVYEAIGDYQKASEAFRRAAADYQSSARKTTASASAFNQFATYMDAWAEIEQARLHHEREQFQTASDAYSKVSEKLSTTRDWNNLVDHYKACSLLEAGEAFSREEKPEAALEVFEQAKSIFQKTAAGLEVHLKDHDESNGRELADWLRITLDRASYSQGRAELENAKILDKKGEEEGSAEKYRSASKTFQQLLADTHNPQARSEMETLMLFTQAWAKMKEAETQAFPETYSQAAALFLKAKDATPRKRFRLLAQANASICKALEAGSSFRLTHNSQLYSEIKNQMQTAADYYQQSGFENAAGWTRATQRLFDALAYLAAAEAEIDSKKKTEFYHLTERYLELAAKLYDQAGFKAKKEEAVRYLKHVKEDKELTLSPIQALAENPALSGSPIASVSLVRDQALGLDRFEAAIVVGNIDIKQKQLSVGAELTMELELANIGKTAATLVKLENLVPNGLEVDAQRISHRVEDNHIDMKGKRLEYLKTHELKVPLKATRKGAFEIKPKVLFVDEKGNYRSYEFEPTPVTVSELGISGWLKGPK